MRKLNYVSQLTPDEAQMLDEFRYWLEDNDWAPTTAVLYHSLMAKYLVLEIEWPDVKSNMRAAWHAFESFLESTLVSAN